ncbi:hypothetical protein NUW54_g11043 [Trametes sanguinea]|uniref:Uncharacterized protein n=1 Tax=Trametes sanguinea TaxID=158606 RepID=A0ACC1NP84_9APHY|nr:hypothetical protein NUW54_g11043 [Trametes sanguinea]
MGAQSKRPPPPPDAPARVGARRSHASRCHSSGAFITPLANASLYAHRGYLGEHKQIYNAADAPVVMSERWARGDGHRAVNSEMPLAVALDIHQPQARLGHDERSKGAFRSHWSFISCN